MTEIQINVNTISLDDPQHVVKQFSFFGQLDESNVDDKAKEIYAQIESLPPGAGVIFDFSDLEYMNSKSIGYLADWYSKISAKNGKLIITQARENISDILSVVGLTKVIPITMTLDEAKLELMKMA